MEHTFDAKTFRQRILKPTEGVFLFHPRAIRRLIQFHLNGVLDEHAVIPDLPYYLMPRAYFLRGLEEENPDALSIIEGLSLPEKVILLPMPSSRQLEETDAKILLRRYWARRFEAEIFKSWRLTRQANQDHDTFGAEALKQLIGEYNYAEVRQILEHDQLIVTHLDDEKLTAHFIAFVVRLRFFSPGSRSYFFPAMENWKAFDRWLKDSGLDIPSPKSQRVPQLLARSRPAGVAKKPNYSPDLPLQLTCGINDPDLKNRANIAFITEQDSTPTENNNLDLDTREQQCIDVFHQAFRTEAHPKIIGLKLTLMQWLFPVMIMLVKLFTLISQHRKNQWLDRALFRTRLIYLKYLLKQTKQAEYRSRFGQALNYLHQVHRLCLTNNVISLIQKRESSIQVSLTDSLEATWKLTPQISNALLDFIKKIQSDPEINEKIRLHFLFGFEKLFIEGRTSYYKLQPLRWVFTKHQPLQRGLPFQSPLRALKILKSLRKKLYKLPWKNEQLTYFSHRLKQIEQKIGQHLKQQLGPQISDFLQVSGFPENTPQQKATRNKLKAELLDVIEQRCLLRFTDLRDIISRNELRLPDITSRTWWYGDRLSRFDLLVGKKLPDVYLRGEFYLKGLQRLVTPLFGTPIGRFLTRYFIFPFLVSLVILEVISHLLGFISGGSYSEWINLPFISFFAVIFGVIFYTKKGRESVKAIAQSFYFVVTFLLFRLFFNIIRWQPIARILQHPRTKEIQRYVVEPLLIGILIMLPIFLILYLSNSYQHIVLMPLLVIGFSLGNFFRNTPAGRLSLDSMTTRAVNLWQSMKQKLLSNSIKFLMEIFKGLMDSLQQALHWVDEKVSHSHGEGSITMISKAIITPFWKMFSYFTQFYITVLVEPQINPIKHFPVVTVSHKFMIPFLPKTTLFFLALLAPFVPQVIAVPFVAVTVFLLPGLFGFLVWEMKENWKLYRANHSEKNQPAPINSHGETLPRLMIRGFHSGSLSKSFDTLRKTILKEADQEKSIAGEIYHAEMGLTELTEQLEKFVARELIEPLKQLNYRSKTNFDSLKLSHIKLGTQSLQFNLLLIQKDDTQTPFQLRYVLKEETLYSYLFSDSFLPKHYFLEVALSTFMERCDAVFDKKTIDNLMN
jgi:hypothetical protein